MFGYAPGLEYFERLIGSSPDGHGEGSGEPQCGCGEVEADEGPVAASETTIEMRAEQSGVSLTYKVVAIVPDMERLGDDHILFDDDVAQFKELWEYLIAE